MFEHYSFVMYIQWLSTTFISETKLHYSSVGNILLKNNNTNLSVYHALFSDCPDRRTDYDGSRDAWIFQKSWIWKGQFWRQRYNTYTYNLHSCKPHCVVQRTIKFSLHCCVYTPDCKRRVMPNICMLSTFMRSYSLVTNLWDYILFLHQLPNFIALSRLP